MAMNKARANRVTSKKAAAGRKRVVSRGPGLPPVITSPLVGKIKRADIRKAIRAVIAERKKPYIAMQELSGDLYD
jgi:hypothetical protein